MAGRSGRYGNIERSDRRRGIHRVLDWVMTGRGRYDRLPNLAAVLVAGAIGGLAVFAVVGDDEQEQDAEPTAVSTAVARAADSTAADSTAATGAPVTALRFDPRAPSGVFALVERPDGRLAAGFDSPLDEPAQLAADVRTAVPDGRGGVVYATENKVWWLCEASAEPVVIEAPGLPFQLVGLRHMEGRPTVLVLIGDELVGYDGGDRRFSYVFDQFSGDIGHIAIDGDVAVAIIPSDGGAATVELVSLSTGEHRLLVPAASAEEADAPLAVAVSADRVVVPRRSLPALVLTTDGTEVGVVELGVDGQDTFSMDLAGDQVLVAFGEAVTATDIKSGDREMVGTPDGWVRGAVWADPVARPEPAAGADVVRFRVDTEAIEADVNDPYLNVRLGPGTGNDILAKLPSTYTGLRWTGEQETTSDGAIWYEVELLDPVAVTLLEPLHGAKPVGWVNSALLVPLPEGLPATIAEVPPCASTYDPIAPGAGSRPAEHVYALESSYLSDRCLRIVITFGPGTAPVSLEEAPDGRAAANAVPVVWEFMSGGSGVGIDLGGIGSVWSGATETADGVYVVRQADGTLQLRSPIPNKRVTVQELAKRGIVVVDLLVDTDSEPPAAGPGVVLTQGPYRNAGSFEVTGIARPFEANLEVAIEDDQGRPVQAVYSGSLFFGTVRATEYAVQTTDWTEAWAPFAVKAEGLAPGDYTMVLNADGGADNPRTLRVPFSITDSGPEPTLIGTEDLDTVKKLMDFARGNAPAASVPLAAQVTLGLGPAEARILSKVELAEPAAWISDVDEFDGFVGDFSALETLARSGAIRITSGSIPQCAGPRREWPVAFDGLRQINIEPIGVDSCIQWYAVILFLNATDRIEAVVLDLYGP